jgi:hypothetical protein
VVFIESREMVQNGNYRLWFTLGDVLLRKDVLINHPEVVVVVMGTQRRIELVFGFFVCRIQRILGVTLRLTFIPLYSRDFF